MEWSEAPGSVINPRPSPWTFVNPLTVGVGRPVRIYLAWNPNPAVFRRVPPSAVRIEIFRSDYIGRNVPSGNGVIFAAITHLAPRIESVLMRCPVNLVRQCISAGEASLLVLFNANARTLSGRLALASPYRYQRRIRIGINVKPVIACLQNRECLVGRIHFIYFAMIKVSYMQIHRTLVQSQLYRIVADIGQRQTALGPYADQAGANVEFGA